MKKVFLWILFFCNPRVKCSDLTSLPTELIENILRFKSPDYLQKIQIAAALNKDNFFGPSSRQVLNLLGIDTSTENMLLSCKKLYSLCVINETLPFSQEYKPYIDFLSLFDLSQKQKMNALQNLAYIFFNINQGPLKDKDSWIFLDGKPKFWEGFAFALTLDHPELVIKRSLFYSFVSIKNLPAEEKPMYFRGYKEKQIFFANLEWLEKNFVSLSKNKIEKFFILDSLCKLVGYKLDDSYNYRLQKFLETECLQKFFVSFLKKEVLNILYSKFNSFLLHLEIGDVFDPSEIMMIFNCISKWEMYKSIDCMCFLKDQETDTYKNLLIVSSFLQVYFKDEACLDCYENVKSSIRTCDNGSCLDLQYFWQNLLRAEIKSTGKCNHTIFDNTKAVDFIKNFFSEFDETNCKKIFLFLQEKEFILSKNLFCYESFFNKDSILFKNMLNLVSYYQKCQNKNFISSILKKKELSERELSEKEFEYKRNSLSVILLSTIILLKISLFIYHCFVLINKGHACEIFASR